MNLLFLDQFSDVGGAQRCLLDLLPAILDRGWKAWVAAPGDGPLLAKCKALGAGVERLHCGPYSLGRKSLADFARFAVDLPRLRGQIAGWIEQYGIDLLYVNGPRLAPAAHPRTPVLFHCHSYLAQRYAAGLVRWSLGRVNAASIACCRYVAEPLTGKSHIVYYGVADCAAARSTSTARRIGMVGRISREKGQAEFLQAARLLLRAFPDCRFLVCGAPLFSDPNATSYFEEIRRLAADLPVEFCGWQDDVSPIYASLDLLLVPSLISEATPRVIVEAYAAGVPVLASRLGGIPEIVDDGETGCLIPSVTPEALAEKARSLLEAPEKLRAMGEAARRAWRQRFTLARYQQRLCDIIEAAGRRYAT